MKKTEGTKEGLRPEEKASRYLKYTFNEKELKEISKELGRQTAEIKHLEDEKKAVTSDLSAKINQAKANQSVLAENVNNGYDYRNVECRKVFDEPKPGKKTIIRLDTGEVVGIENMTEEERQTSFA